MDKRHFTVVEKNGKEHGLYISSTPSSAAKKAVSKLCGSNKNKKVEFCLREVTQGSKKKTYGPYFGEMKKLKKPIELNGRVIQYEINVHLKKSKKMMGGGPSYRNTKEQINRWIEENNFQEIFNTIFNGDYILQDLIEEIKINKNLFLKMIDFIINKISNQEQNKYFFIICYIVSIAYAHGNTENTIFNYLITKIGIDKLIEIVFGINYGTVFDRVIIHISSGNGITRLDQHNINFRKKKIFNKLLTIFSQKMTLEEFKNLLIKLFSIEDKSFMDDELLDRIFIILTNYTRDKQPSFKLLDFLFEHKARLINFIRIFKNYFVRSYISRELRNRIGTEQTQQSLFQNV